MQDLPNWDGAATVYRRAQAIATHLCRAAYETQRAQYKRKTGFRFYAPQEARDIIDAMNRGDEETLKAIVLANLTIALGAE